MLITTFPGMLAAAAGLGLLFLAGRHQLSLRAPQDALRDLVVGAPLHVPRRGDLASGTRSPPAHRSSGTPWPSAWWIGLWALTAGVVLVYRVGLPLVRSHRHRLEVVSVEDEAPGVVSVICRGRHLDRLPVSGGQFLQWRFLVSGMWWQAHPYSLSAMPTGQPDPHHGQVARRPQPLAGVAEAGHAGGDRGPLRRLHQARAQERPRAAGGRGRRRHADPRPARRPAASRRHRRSSCAAGTATSSCCATRSRRSSASAPGRLHEVRRPARAGAARRAPPAAPGPRRRRARRVRLRPRWLHARASSPPRAPAGVPETASTTRTSRSERRGPAPTRKGEHHETIRNRPRRHRGGPRLRPRPTTRAAASHACPPASPRRPSRASAPASPRWAPTRRCQGGLGDLQVRVSAAERQDHGRRAWPRLNVHGPQSAQITGSVIPQLQPAGRSPPTAGRSTRSPAPRTPVRPTRGRSRQPWTRSPPQEGPMQHSEQVMGTVVSLSLAAEHDTDGGARPPSRAPPSSACTRWTECSAPGSRRAR